MKNMKIKARMILALGTVILLSMITLIFSLVGTVTTGNSYDKLVQRDMAASQYLLSTRINTNTAARYLRDMALEEYSADLDSLIQEQLNSLDETMKVFIELYPVNDNRAVSYQNAVSAWESTAKDIIADLKSGNDAQARTALQQSCTPTLNSLTTQATELSSVMSSNVNSTLTQVGGQRS